MQKIDFYYHHDEHFKKQLKSKKNYMDFIDFNINICFFRIVWWNI